MLSKCKNKRAFQSAFWHYNPVTGIVFFSARHVAAGPILRACFYGYRCAKRPTPVCGRHPLRLHGRQLQAGAAPYKGGGGGDPVAAACCGIAADESPMRTTRQFPTVQRPLCIKCKPPAVPLPERAPRLSLLKDRLSPGGKWSDRRRRNPSASRPCRK